MPRSATTINHVFSVNEEHTVSKRPNVDIKFKNLTYNVNTLTKGKKQIIHGINGEFKSGELTAIMGPSGAGKSSLLNVLAGFRLSGCEGDISYNNIIRDEESINDIQKLLCYIQQEDELRKFLTVRESMEFAINLKLGRNISAHAKEKKVLYLMKLLGLSDHQNTRIKYLSGGQKRRLSIALELISDPPILFLDEPTTGLDSYAVTSCVSLLKDLSRQQRTIICTIHQPSALIFEMFDHLYAMADGKCIYQGPTGKVVPFMKSLGIVCPTYHNPADFLIEVAVGCYTADINNLVVEVEKTGRLDNDQSTYEITEKDGDITYQIVAPKNNLNDFMEFTNSQNFPPLWYQFYNLVYRNFLSYGRNYTNLFVRTLLHVVVALCYGIAYSDIGKTANSLLGNYVYCYGTTLFLTHAGQMAVTLSFPLEYRILKREYFNRWFKLASFYLSLIVVEIPYQVICAFVYVILSYYLTGQPMELFRFSLFFTIVTFSSLVGQSIGYFVGVVLPVTMAVFIGPLITVFMSFFGFATKYSDIVYPLNLFYTFSFFRIANHDALITLYSFNRSELQCDPKGFGGELGYCHYKNAMKFIKEMEFEDFKPFDDFCKMLSFILFFYLLTVIVVAYKLKKR